MSIGILQLLPLLEGWRRRIMLKYWYEIPNNPIRRGECSIVLRLSPPREGFQLIAGFFIQVSSRYLNIIAMQRIAGVSTILFTANPLFLYDDGSLMWQSWAIYLTRYDDTDRTYSMKFVPVLPVPLRYEIDIVACLGYPTPGGQVLPRIPLPSKREWVDVEDSEAWINYVGVEYIEIFDVETFEKSLAKQLARIEKYKRMYLRKLLAH